MKKDSTQKKLIEKPQTRQTKRIPRSELLLVAGGRLVWDDSANNG